MFDMERESRNGLRRSIGAHVLWDTLGRERYYQWYMYRDDQLAGPSGNWSLALGQVMVILVRIKESASFSNFESLTDFAKASFTATLTLAFISEVRW